MHCLYSNVALYEQSVLHVACHMSSDMVILKCNTSKSINFEVRGYLQGLSIGIMCVCVRKKLNQTTVYN